MPPDSTTTTMAAPYPADWVRKARTRDGTSFVIRPLSEEDRGRELGFIAALSDETRYMRTMHPLRVLPPHLLDQLMDVDYDKRMAFVASILDEDGVERFVGVARYGVEPDGKSAEFAVTTTDEWQGRGVAAQLMKCLLQYARFRGVRTVFGLMLPENVKMIALAKTLGMHVEHLFEERVVRASCDLGSLLPLLPPRPAPRRRRAAAPAKKKSVKKGKSKVPPRKKKAARPAGRASAHVRTTGKR